MGQLNIYVPDDLEKKIKKRAKIEGKSVSSFVLNALKDKIEPDGWSPEFLAMISTPNSDFPGVKALPLQKRKSLDDL